MTDYSKLTDHDLDVYFIAFLCRVFVASTWYHPIEGRGLYCKTRELVSGDRAECEFYKTMKEQENG